MIRHSMVKEVHGATQTACHAGMGLQTKADSEGRQQHGSVHKANSLLALRLQAVRQGSSRVQRHAALPQVSG